MLYVVFCIPVVTIGPATAGLTKVLRNYARGEHAFLWGDFIEAFKKNFKQSLLYSLLDFVILGILILDLLSVGNVPNKILMTLSLAAILFSLTVYIFMRYYVYNMMVTFHLTLWQLLKNAFILLDRLFQKFIFNGDSGADHLFSGFLSEHYAADFCFVFPLFYVLRAVD